ncbi:MAG: glycosyltransferase family 39 protein [Anaerolineales bacterium]|nr:glycosyltransferase family 39 protein [Anaerolineales bacterium]
MRTFFVSDRSAAIFLSLITLAVLALGIGLRLFDLTDQPIDFHPTRQLRGAIVARGMYYQMVPEADPALRQQALAYWASTGQYEPPILERAVALTYLVIGEEQFWIARLYNTAAWLIASLAILGLARRLLPSGPHSKLAAIAALAYFMALPFSVQASRSFQPDPGMVMWLALFTYALFRWDELPGQGAPSARESWKWALLAGAFAGMAVLTKAVAAYSVAGAALAVLVYGSWSQSAGLADQTPPKNGKRLMQALGSLLRNPQVWVIALLAVIPTLAYYLSRSGRAAEYFSSWTLSLSHLLIEPSFYLRWANLVQSLLGWWALLLALAGVILASPRTRALLLGLWAGYLAYGLFLPYQMYTHSYYHLQLVLIVALSIVPAIQALAGWVAGQKSPAWKIAAAAGALLLLAWLSWQAMVPLYGQDYRSEPVYWQEVASHLPADGKIMALTQDYGYRLMYYGWRKVTLWPNRGEQNLSKLRGSEKEFEAYFAKHTAGYAYFLITAFKQFEDQPELKQYLTDHYDIAAQAQGYLIFDLRAPK